MWHESRHPLKIIVDGIPLLCNLSVFFALGYSKLLHTEKRKKVTLNKKTCQITT